MPIYIFQNPNTKEIKEIIQSMNEEHIYIDSNGLKWDRIFASPQTSIKDTKLDFRSKKDVEKWENVYKKRYNHNKK